MSIRKSMCAVCCGNAGSGGRDTTARSNRGNRITAVHLASSLDTLQAINNTSAANTVDLVILSLLQRQFNVQMQPNEKCLHPFRLKLYWFNGLCNNSNLFWITLSIVSQNKCENYSCHYQESPHNSYSDVSIGLFICWSENNAQWWRDSLLKSVFWHKCCNLILFRKSPWKHWDLLEIPALYLIAGAPCNVTKK